MAPRLAPERSALHRTTLSGPARRALEDGLLTGTVLDYGCGRGGDVERLSAAGYLAQGWDPHYRPTPEPRPADTVLCTYVLNVLPIDAVRAQTLTCAWALARRALVVAVRDNRERGRLQGREHADGVVTTRGTFHHLFAPAELRQLIENTLGIRATAVDPGLVYAFRDSADRLAYLSRRHDLARFVDPEGEILARLAGFMEAHGRPPTGSEQPRLLASAAAAYQRAPAAIRIAVGQVEPDKLRLAQGRRQRELLVLLALERLHGERRLSDLPPDRAVDCRVFFGSHKNACLQADRLLVSVGRPEQIRRAIRAAVVGKPTQNALYVHVDAERFLPAALQIYAACADLVAGRPRETNVLKLHQDKACVSFLHYPEFDLDPHPRLASSLTVDLKARDAGFTDWSAQQNRPLLHRKEEFLHPSHPRFALYRRLTLREVAARLYAEPHRIGREQGWEEVLQERGYRVMGHRLVGVKGPK